MKDTTRTAIAAILAADDTVAPAAAERGESGGKRAAEIGFAARGGIGARGVERFEEKAGVRREWAERLGVGAEGDEAGAVAVEIAREVR